MGKVTGAITEEPPPATASLPMVTIGIQQRRAVLTGIFATRETLAPRVRSGIGFEEWRVEVEVEVEVEVGSGMCFEEKWVTRSKAAPRAKGRREEIEP